MRKILTSMVLSSLTIFALNMGEVPPELILEKENGGYLDGTAWNSSMLKNKLYVLFYIDPDEKDSNNEFFKALNKEQFDLNYFGSVVIVNFAATWLPDRWIEFKMKKNQKKFSNIIYVQDRKSVAVKEWELKDDSSNVLIFNQKGSLIYRHDGKLLEKDIDRAMAFITVNLN